MRGASAAVGAVCGPRLDGLEVKRAAGCGRCVNIGASRIRIGCWGHYTINIRRTPQNSIGNCLGPYIIRFLVTTLRLHDLGFRGFMVSSAESLQPCA